ncbi:hypothetical protein BDR05DRAFT_960240 [Suillus weaverae]|nr:hypothetical protein BDR05DRAFT_960240 [Suillus weaverae]
MRSLKFMDLRLNHKMISSFNIPLALAGLTNLEIAVNGVDSFFPLLRLCPNLSSLTMIGIFAAIETSETLAHDKLQSLRTSGDIYTWTRSEILGYSRLSHFPIYARWRSAVSDNGLMKSSRRF